MLAFWTLKMGLERVLLNVPSYCEQVRAFEFSETANVL